MNKCQRILYGIEKWASIVFTWFIYALMAVFLITLIVLSRGFFLLLIAMIFGGFFLLIYLGALFITWWTKLHDLAENHCPFKKEES